MTAILDLPLQVTLSNIVYYNYVRYVLKYPGVNSRANHYPRPGLTPGTALHQWRNVISGGPRFKIFEGPPPP
jgi:hypothetical protein